MDRVTRKDLKTDKFAEEVFDIFDWTSEHKQEVIRYGSIAVVVLLIVFGVIYYNRYQATAREEALAQALRIDQATVGADVQPQNLHYDTQEQKDQARLKAFSEVASKYSGTAEGAIAEMHVAQDEVNKGNFTAAEKNFKHVVDTAPKEFAAIARLSLGQVYAAQGKTQDAQKVLQEAINNPASTVSKEQATITLAQVMQKSNPAEARKLVEPLRNSTRTAVSRDANAVASDIQNPQQTQSK